MANFRKAFVSILNTGSPSDKIELSEQAAMHSTVKNFNLCYNQSSEEVGWMTVEWVWSGSTE
jgi:hypothetical protein